MGFQKQHCGEYNSRGNGSVVLPSVHQECSHQQEQIDIAQVQFPFYVVRHENAHSQQKPPRMLRAGSGNLLYIKSQDQ